MNLIEALRQADGKPVKTPRISDTGCVQQCGEYIMFRDGIFRKSEQVRSDQLLADDWYVVEPKSKIDEAIEREVADYFGVSPMESHRSQVAEAMRRVVNLALDEAKKCNKQTFCEICEKQFAERIDAIKVKE